MHGRRLRVDVEGAQRAAHAAAAPRAGQRLTRSGGSGRPGSAAIGTDSAARWVHLRTRRRRKGTVWGVDGSAAAGAGSGEAGQAAGAGAGQRAGRPRRHVHDAGDGGAVVLSAERRRHEQHAALVAVVAVGGVGADKSQRLFAVKRPEVSKPRQVAQSARQREGREGGCRHSDGTVPAQRRRAGTVRPTATQGHGTP